MITTGSAASWRWRRIVFAAKGLQDAITGFVGNYETSNGWPRAIIDYSGADPSVTRNQWENFMFEGNAGQDWYSTFTAKVDTKRCTLLYDRTRIINSGNQSGRFAAYKLWHPINKNVVYANDEAGEGKSNQSTSVQSKAGLGDVYVIDMFSCASGNAADQLVFEPECTTYWHEK